MCPCCRRNGLYPTGHFWQCDACGLRITEQALRYERVASIPGSERAIGDKRHGGKAIGQGTARG